MHVFKINSQDQKNKTKSGGDERIPGEINSELSSAAAQRITGLLQD
jgi:hypothetical protein